jgi:uncharacterized protein (DUF58 family)
MKEGAEKTPLRDQPFHHPWQPDVVLGTRQIYILPTRHGLRFTLVLLALALAAVNYNNALAYLLTFLLASMAVVSLLHAQRNLLRLRITAAGAGPVFAGQAAAFRISLHNRNDARFALQLESAQAMVSPMAAGIDGETGSGGLQDGEDFTGLRAYQPGDALARISWKTLARGQGLHTKEFRAPLAESVWLDWDAFAPHDTETRLALLCRATLDAEDRGLAYGLRLPGVTLEPDSGAGHCHHCLEALALHENRV